MTIRSDGRHVISLTMKSDLYKQMQSRCDQLDLPVTVWVRELIQRELARPTITGLQAI